MTENFFDEQGEQSQIKAEIVSKYFFVWAKVIIATHPDQALAMLKVPSPLELRTLGAIRYHDNLAVLHTDESVLPGRRAAWAAWNYERVQAPAHSAQWGETTPDVCLHYLINKLQPLPWQQSVIVSLNPLHEVSANKILGEFAYSHPVFDAPAIKAQQQVAWLQGKQATFYCGAWCGYGFHEDGYQSGVAAAKLALGQVLARVEEFA